MSRQINFPSIEQYRHTVKLVRDRSNYHNVPPPNLVFHGTVKLHGTNAAVARNLQSGETWAQSRTSVITPLNDNAGFAKFVVSQSKSFDLLFELAKIVATIVLKPSTTVIIYGEWCGQGIQKGVAINNIPRCFVIFGVRVWDYEIDEAGLEGGDSYWFKPIELASLVDIANYKDLNAGNIFCIEKFPTWNMQIDFIKPEDSQNLLQSLTQGVEDECPVGKAFISEAVNGCEVFMENGKLISNKIIPNIVETEVKKILLSFPEFTKITLST